MARRHGRAPRGQRLRVGVPHGHWLTTTFVAGLSTRGIIAPFVRPGSIRRPGTLGARLDAFAGTGPGFETLRIILSVSILCWYSVLASYGPAGEAAVWRTPYSAVLTTLLPMFFSLSGFLVMGSATRNPDLKRFISLRGLRILPALTTEVCISTILLGSLLTTLPISRYCTNPLFLKYFGSSMGMSASFFPACLAIIHSRIL